MFVSDQMLFGLRRGRKRTGKEREDSHPALPHVLTRGKDQNLQTRVQRINTMIKQLPQRATLPRPPRLAAIDRIERLVQEQADGPAVVDPAGAVLVEGGVVPEQGEEVRDDEEEAGEGDEVGGHGHGEALDDDVGVEGLEDVFGGEGVVDAGVFVFFEGGEFPLANVDHDGRCCVGSVYGWFCFAIVVVGGDALRCPQHQVFDRAGVESGQVRTLQVDG